MSEKRTVLTLPGAKDFNGWSDWDHVPASEVIASARRYIAHMRRMVEEAEAAADEDFHIYTCRGVYVERDKKVIQEGCKPVGEPVA